MALCGYKMIGALGCLLGAAAIMVVPMRALAQEYPYPQLPPSSFLAKLLAPQVAEEPAQGNSGANSSKEKANTKEQGSSGANSSKEKSNSKDEDSGKDKEKDKDKDDTKVPWYTIHAQTTVVSQGSFPFRSPYQGPNSFLSAHSLATTMTGTLFLGMKVWEGGEVYFNPEISGGFGLSGTSGLGGEPNGEAVRVGIPQPTPYIARLYLRQTVGLSGEMEKVEDGVNQIAGERDTHRLVISIGRVPAADSFDNNSYSHDPRTQFLNWTIMYAGAWDYPANVRGYDYGGSIELDMKTWAIRYGIFGEPAVANGSEIDPHFLRANGSVLEYERRYNWNEHPGKLRLLSYLNNAHMGNYRIALRDMPLNPDITQTRAYRVKYGFGINWEQEITKELGLFARVTWDDGHTETFAFTEVDGSVAVGLLLKGKRWCRPQDQVGLAFVVNDLSNGHRDYLAAGGLGFELGDGRLSYATENIVELYYNWELKKGINVTLDVQAIDNPGYNRDRGPVAALGLRVHLEY